MSECKIFEYDGAYSCLVHGIPRRAWGAISDGDPCLTNMQKRIAALEAELKAAKEERNHVTSAYSVALEQLAAHDRTIARLKEMLRQCAYCTRCPVCGGPPKHTGCKPIHLVGCEYAELKEE